MSGMHYEFEDASDRRHRDAVRAESECEVLVRRLGGEPATLRPFDERLVRFAQNTALSVGWYDHSLRGLQRWRRFWQYSIVALFVGALAALFLPLSRPESGAGASVATVSALIAGLVGLLKILAELTDSSKRMAGFHQARSKLKTLLYGLEGEWRGKAFPGGALDPAFGQVLEDASREARAILEAEQLTYFESLANPSTLLTGVTGSMNQIKGDLQAALVALEKQEERTRREAQERARQGQPP